MSYATRADLEDRYTAALIAQLETSGRDIGQALADADAEIDSYLSTRYVVPLSGAVDPRVVAAACDIAHYKLFTVQSEGEPAERYKLALAWLRDVSAGRANVTGAQARTDLAPQAGMAPPRAGQADSGFCWERY